MTEWTHAVFLAAKRTVGFRVVKQKHSPWFTYSLHRLKRRRNKLKRQLRRDHTNKVKERQYREAKRLFQRKQRQCYYEFTKRQIENISSGPSSDRFRFFKALQPKRVAVYPRLTDIDKVSKQRVTATTNKAKATLLNHFFVSSRFDVTRHTNDIQRTWQRIDRLLTKWRYKYRAQELRRDRQSTEPSLQLDISMTEVEAALRHLDFNKATCCDLIHNAFLKRGGFAVTASLHMPKTWKQQDILPIANPVLSPDIESVLCRQGI